MGKGGAVSVGKGGTVSVGKGGAVSVGTSTLSVEASTLSVGASTLSVGASTLSVGGGAVVAVGARSRISVGTTGTTGSVAVAARVGIVSAVDLTGIPSDELLGAQALNNRKKQSNLMSCIMVALQQWVALLNKSRGGSRTALAG